MAQDRATHIVRPSERRQIMQPSAAASDAQLLGRIERWLASTRDTRPLLVLVRGRRRPHAKEK